LVRHHHATPSVPKALNVDNGLRDEVCRQFARSTQPRRREGGCKGRAFVVELRKNRT
jgi:hypothetical protein